MRKQFSFGKLIASPLLTPVLVFILIFSIVALVREVTRRYEIHREILALEQEVESLENENKKLADLLEYLNTEFFREKEARLKLGMQNPGEKLIIISPRGEEIPVIIEKEEEEKTPSNPRKWWEKFF